MQPAETSLKAAYDRAKLARHGITFEQAMNDGMFKKCLTRIAETLEHIKQPPLPRHAPKQQWSQFKDN